MSADQGNLDAQCQLGICYMKGIGFDQDKMKAIKIYESLSNQGNANAQHELGICYENGLGVEKNIQEAVKFYQIGTFQRSCGQFLP